MSDVPDHAQTARQLRRVRRRAEATLAETTMVVYQRKAHAFTSWCTKAHRNPYDPDALATYLEEKAKAGRTITTLEGIRAAVIATQQLERELAGDSSPVPARDVEVQWAVDAQARKRGRKKRKAAILSFDELESAIAALPTSTLGLRNRALLSMGYAIFGRRSEIVTIHFEHIVETSLLGLMLEIPFSKTDQEGKGVTIPVLAMPESPACPLYNLNAWLAKRGSHHGPLFEHLTNRGEVGRVHRALTAQMVNLIVKDAVRAIGLDPKRYSAHSLRRSSATEAVRAGANVFELMKNGRWSSSAVNEYVEVGQAYDTAALRHVRDRRKR